MAGSNLISIRRHIRNYTTGSVQLESHEYMAGTFKYSYLHLVCDDKRVARSQNLRGFLKPQVAHRNRATINRIARLGTRGSNVTDGARTIAIIVHALCFIILFVTYKYYMRLFLISNPFVL